MCPTFRDVEYAGVEQLQLAIIIGKAAFSFRRFAKLSVHCRHRIASINSLVNIAGALKPADKHPLFTAPTFDHRGLFCAPLRF